MHLLRLGSQAPCSTLTNASLYAFGRPVMEPNGFDHDDGMNAFSVDKSTVIRKRGVYVGGAPAFLMAQVQKDRDMFSVVVSSFLVGWHEVWCMIVTLLSLH